jgi:solute carrier family 25 phosphate transporter 3
MSPSATCRCVQSKPTAIHHQLNNPTLCQVNPAKYNGLVPTLKLLSAEEGSRGLWKGFGPTLVGYSLQGMFKYGLYEVFKDAYMNLAGEEASEKYKPLIWLAGSASAEVFADIALCPLEMTKVKIQTSATGTFPIPFGAALAQMRATKAETRYPFGSIVPLWSRQVSFSSRLSPIALFVFLETHSARQHARHPRHDITY